MSLRTQSRPHRLPSSTAAPPSPSKAAHGSSHNLSAEIGTGLRESHTHCAGKSQDDTVGVPHLVYEVLRSSAQPLDAASRNFFEPRFGHDFGRVRIHRDAQAAESANAVNALAYTVGMDIVFGETQYRPETDGGKRLLAHELTHVVQQSLAAVPASLDVSAHSDETERAAEQASSEVLSSGLQDTRGRGTSITGEHGSDSSLVPKKAVPQFTVLPRAGEVPRQLLQRAEIPYRTVTWADFKGRPPAGTTDAANTSSGFDVPGWRAKEAVEDTKKACTLDQKSTTEFKATVGVNPDRYDGVKAYMNQEESWVLPRHKDGGRGYCTMKSDECKKYFDTESAKAKKDCAELTVACKEAFKESKKKKEENYVYSVHFDGTEVKATSEAECSTALAKSCEAQSVKDARFARDDSDVSAKTKADCAKSFFTDCTTREAAQSARLLKHEQGHFDISNVMAGKARSALKAKAATFSVNETMCGRTEAMNAARTSFAKLGGLDSLGKLGQDWIDSKNQATTDYDDQTNHGRKTTEQTTWEGKIAGGLKEYDPTAPVPAPSPTAPSSGPTVPAPTP